MRGAYMRVVLMLEGVGVGPTAKGQRLRWVHEQFFYFCS